MIGLSFEANLVLLIILCLILLGMIYLRIYLFVKGKNEAEQEGQDAEEIKKRIVRNSLTLFILSVFAIATLVLLLIYSETFRAIVGSVFSFLVMIGCLFVLPANVIIGVLKRLFR